MLEIFLMATMMIGGTEFMDDCLSEGGYVMGFTAQYPANRTETSDDNTSGAAAFDFEDDELDVVIVGVIRGGRQWSREDYDNAVKKGHFVFYEEHTDNFTIEDAQLWSGDQAITYAVLIDVDGAHKVCMTVEFHDQEKDPSPVVSDPPNEE